MRAAVLAVLCASASMAQTEAFRLMPADAQVVIGLRLGGIMQSAAGRQMKDQIQKQMGQAAPGVEGLSGMMSGLLDSVDSVLITSSSGDFFKNATGPNAAKAAQAPMLIVVNGRFESSGLAGLLQSGSKAQPELYRGVSIFRGDAKEVEKNRIALLDPNTLLLGDRRELTGAIDRARGAQPEGAASPRLSALAKNDFFFSMEIPPLAKTPANPKDPASQMMKDLTGLDLGVLASNGMSLAIDLRTASGAAAERMSTQIQALMALGAMQMNNEPQLAGLMQRISIKPVAAGVRMSLSMSEAEVMQLARVAQRRAAAPAGQSAPVREGPPVVDGLGGTTEIKTEKPAPGSGGIKISGLDPEPKKP